MKDEKKVTKAEEVKEEAKTEENGVELTDEELSSVAAGIKATEPAVGSLPIPAHNVVVQ